MATDIKKLIAQLKKEVPEVSGNPILDEIETAYDDEEASEGQDEQDEADAGLGDDQGAEDEDSHEPPAPAPKGKSASKKLKLPFM